ncbi:class I SAM-dependent methyltransferase [Rhodopseudomonas palustris]|uniref:class I SAM-dependent methyltransferase n=1 Tax=Rhodopseudomonas palustris TaxID=1076 RepID=UPI000699755E|nr:class I SAM-dependent methyltransferase [Rhodopseudomonas palustris]
MKTRILKIEEVLRGYDAVSSLYGYIPPLSHWRAWEYASYKHYRLNGRILDIGCGDGQYFRLVWPDAHYVTGVDMDPEAAARGRQSGVYREIHVSPAHRIPEQAASFDNAFANCSLEHMDHLEGVLSEIHRCLKPKGSLLCSVVTNRFVEWSLLPAIVSEAGFEDVAEGLRAKFMEFHHLTNPLPVELWMARFERAGFQVEEHIPILPATNGKMWILADNLWHVTRKNGGEFGDVVHPIFASNPNFPRAFRKIMEGLLQMETDWTDCIGAVFSVRKVAA